MPQKILWHINVKLKMFYLLIYNRIHDFYLIFINLVLFFSFNHTINFQQSFYFALEFQFYLCRCMRWIREFLHLLNFLLRQISFTIFEQLWLKLLWQYLKVLLERLQQKYQCKRSFHLASLRELQK